MRKLWIVFLLAFYTGCKVQHQPESLQIISEKIGDNAIIDYNVDRSFALIQEKLSVIQSGEYTSSYLLIRVADNKIIKEGKVVEGYIRWINDDVVEVFEMPGVLKDGQNPDDFKKQINVREFQKNTPGL